ncbi:ABC-type transporter MlaC component/ABC-type transporter Mla MlaB component [Lysobacter sp. HA18]
MKRTALSVLLAAAFVAPVAMASAAAPAASQQAGTPSRLVLENSTRMLNTLETRRAEFAKNRTALKQFVSSEFNQMFDRNYAARLVLGAHGRGASDADVATFADALSENLMQRYGSSLLDFNTRLTVKVKSETPIGNGLATRVSTQMLRSGGEPISGRLPDAPGQRPVEGVRRAGRRRELRADLPQPVRRPALACLDRAGRRRSQGGQAAGEGQAVTTARVRRDGDVLHLDGRLDRAAVASTWRAVQPLRAGATRIDVTGVDAVDSAGLAMLAELAAGGLAVNGEPAGLAELRAAYRLDGSLGFGA